jgi:hypothetical protein
LLVDHDLVTAFEVGWSVLYEDVSLFVADRLVATLADLHCLDADTRRGPRLHVRLNRNPQRARPGHGLGRLVAQCGTRPERRHPDVGLLQLAAPRR